MKKIFNKTAAVVLSLIMAVIIFLPASEVSADAAGIRIGVSSSMTSEFVGAKITVKAAGSNGTAPYVYKFLYKINNGSWVTAKSYSSTNSVSVTASKAGTYTFRSYAKDKANREIYCDIDMNVREKYVALSNTSTISSTSFLKTTALTVKGLASGGTKPYSFKYYYTDNFGKQTVVKNFCAATSVSIKFPNAGYYTVHAAVKDKDGKTIDKSFNVTVRDNTGAALKNTSTLSTYNVYYGGSITINGSATGGVQPCQYDYYYSVNGSSYKKIAGYTKSQKQNFKFPSSGYFKIKIVAKDYSGKTAEAIKNITVKQVTNKALSINSSINTTNLVDQNTTVTMTAVGGGGTLPYRYAFDYKIGSGEWKTIKDYSTTDKVSLRLSAKGKYTIRVTVLDSDGNKKTRTNTVTSIAKFTKTSSTRTIKTSYGRTSSFSLRSAGTGALYEVYYREPGSTQWNLFQKYSSNLRINYRFRKLGENALLVYSKLNGKETTSNLVVNTYIPDDVYKELDLVNQERAKVGAGALKLDDDLVFVANVRAEEIQTKYAHERPDGRKCFTVLNDYSIKTPSFSGENIAYGYRDVALVMDEWIHSEKHKENILDADFKKIGIGINGLYRTQMFTS